MRTRLSFYNTTSAMLLQLVNMVISFLLPPILILEYGSATNGLVMTIRQIVQYFNIVEGGLAVAAMYALYKPLAERDESRINGILSAANRFYNISGGIFAALIVVSTVIYPAFVSDVTLSSVKIALLVLIIGASGTLEFFAVGKYKVLINADQKAYVISLINTLAVALNAVIIVVLAKLHVDIVLVQLYALASFLLRSLLFTLYARRKYSYLNFKAEADVKAIDKRWDSLYLQILGAVTWSTPILVVSLLCGLREVSVFTVYNIVFAGVQALLSTFNNGLCASFGDLLARNEQETFQRVYKQYEYLYYTLLGWAYACAAILVMPFMGIYTRSLTDASYIRPEIAALFVLSGLLFNVKTPQGMLVISAGLYKETKYQSLAQAIINLGISVALAPFLGIAGVLIGSVVANLYRSIDLLFYIPKVLTKLPPSISIRRVLRLFFLLGLSVLPVLKLVSIRPENYLQWLFWALLASFWCLLVFAAGNIIAEREMARLSWLRVKNLFGRKQPGK